MLPVDNTTTTLPEKSLKTDTRETVKDPSPVISHKQPSIQSTKTPPLPKYEDPPNAPPLPSFLKDREGKLEHSDGRINYALHYKTAPIQDLPSSSSSSSRKNSKGESYANVDLSVYNYTTRTDSERNLLSEPNLSLQTQEQQNNNNDVPANPNSRYSAHLRSRSFSSAPQIFFPTNNNTKEKRERSKSATPPTELR